MPSVGRVIVNLELPAAPEDSIVFRVLKEGVPVVNANVSLVTKGVMPVAFDKVTDEAGYVTYTAFELTGGYPPPIPFSEIRWLLLAEESNSAYGIWYDDISFELGKQYLCDLFRFRNPPTFYVQYKLRDILGRDQIAWFITEVEKWQLGNAGFTMIDVQGAGTNTITIKFQPPWTGIQVQHGTFGIEPVTVSLVASKLFVIAIFGILLILVVLSWSFGAEVKPLLKWLPYILIISAVASLVAAAKTRKK